MSTFASSLVPGLEAAGIEVVIDEAEVWIPEKTGWQVDRKVSRAVRDAGKGFDFVLAWGYRAAWACSEAFYVKKPWGYVAYDTPKTTHDQLIGRLAAARVGVCCSRATKRILDDADAVNLEVIVPGVQVPAGLPTKEVAREQLGIAADARLIVGMGRAVNDSAFDVFDNLLEMLIAEAPRTVGLVKVVGGSRKMSHAKVVDAGIDPWVLIQAADVVLCPDRRAGFKMAAAMGMALAKPVVCRELSSLREIGVPDVSMEFFDSDDDAYYQMLDLMGAPVYMESLGLAARARAEDYLSLDRCVENFARMIRDSAGRR
ncbi:MAG: hypothetical protein ACKVQS_05075 [Fimbriimonadaceae bacterium]